MTKKLFYDDAYITKFSAKVLECTPKDDKFLIVLDETAFYPEGGGQPCDTGYLMLFRDKTMVLAVNEKQDVIYHTCDKAIEVGEEVAGYIDFKKRYDYMQQHTGEHIFSGIAHREYDVTNVGFNIGKDEVTMDFDKPLTIDEIQKIQDLVNQELSYNRKVEAIFPKNLDSIEYRSKKELTGQVRIVIAGGADVCACCGTHTATTCEVSPVVVVDSMAYKGGVRIHILCGKRALDYFKKCNDDLHTVSRLLSAKLELVPEFVEKLQTQNAILKQELYLEKTRYFELLAQTLQDEKVIVYSKENLASDEMATLSKLLLDKSDVNVIVSKQENGQHKLCISSNTLDTNAIGKTVANEYQGKGGGKKGLYQGFINKYDENLKEFIINLV